MPKFGNSLQFYINFDLLPYFRCPQVLVVFSGSSQTMANESISIPDATDRLVEEGVTVIAVGMGPNADPAALLAVVSDPDNVFFEDAVEALKSAVKDAAKTDDDGFPGQNHLKMP